MSQQAEPRDCESPPPNGRPPTHWTPVGWAHPPHRLKPEFNVPPSLQCDSLWSPCPELLRTKARGLPSSQGSGAFRAAVFTPTPATYAVALRGGNRWGQCSGHRFPVPWPSTHRITSSTQIVRERAFNKVADKLEAIDPSVLSVCQPTCTLIPSLVASPQG